MSVGKIQAAYVPSLVSGKANSDILVFGDSLAHGIGQALLNAHESSLHVNSKDGIGSAEILSRIKSDNLVNGSKVAVISAGSNDSISGLDKKLEEIRKALLSKGIKNIVWILPNEAERKNTVSKFASQHGDRVTGFSDSKDGLHPVDGYQTLARDVKKTINTQPSPSPTLPALNTLFNPFAYTPQMNYYGDPREQISFYLAILQMLQNPYPRAAFTTNESVTIPA